MYKIYTYILWDSIPIGDLMGYDVEHMGYKGFHILYILYIKGDGMGFMSPTQLDREFPASAPGYFICEAIIEDIAGRSLMLSLFLADEKNKTHVSKCPFFSNS